MSVVRWSRAVWFGFVIFAVALVALLLPVAWYAYRNYVETRISPVIATSELNSILSAVLSQTELDGMPPPPPTLPLTGEHVDPPEQKPLMLANTTATVCGSEKPRDINCSRLADTDFWPPGFSPAIPLRLRKELVAANQSSVPIECPLSKKVKCGDAATILLAASHGGLWHDFYARFPETAGFMHISNAVLTHDRTEALIYLEFGCGRMCASGRLVLLRRNGDGWLVERQERLWES